MARGVAIRSGVRVQTPRQTLSGPEAALADGSFRVVKRRLSNPHEDALLALFRARHRRRGIRDPLELVLRKAFG